jgi:hypothetical protein
MASGFCPVTGNGADARTPRDLRVQWCPGNGTTPRCHHGNRRSPRVGRRLSEGAGADVRRHVRRTVTSRRRPRAVASAADCSRVSGQRACRRWACAAPILRGGRCKLPGARGHRVGMQPTCPPTRRTRSAGGAEEAISPDAIPRRSYLLHKAGALAVGRPTASSPTVLVEDRRVVAHRSNAARKRRDGEGHEGIGCGNAARLLARGILRGVDRVAGNGTNGFRAEIDRETRRTSSWLRGATDPRPPGGANRQGGAKPRRWNVTGRLAPFGRREAIASRELTPAGTSAGRIKRTTS